MNTNIVSAIFLMLLLVSALFFFVDVLTESADNTGTDALGLGFKHLESIYVLYLIALTAACMIFISKIIAARGK